MPLIRSISGLRGTLSDGLTPNDVVRHATAFAELTNNGPIVVGRDGRPSGDWIESILTGTLAACGVEVRSLGLSPTPTVQMAVEISDAVGGISITASHNPAEWNGLKFLNADGIFLSPQECEEFYALADANVGSYANHTNLGTIVDSQHLVQQHVDTVLALPFIKHETLSKRGFRVVVDAVNASGSVVVPDLLKQLGCDVVPLYCEANGHFPHTPEPLPQNLLSLCEAVRKEQADLGVAVDPDADRLVLIDERGEPIGEEYTITLVTDFILGWNVNQKKQDLTAVVNLSTTRAVDDVAEKHGGQVVRTPVGEINVVEGMKREGGIIGGEGSGGVILPSLHYGRDSLAGIAIVLSALLHHGGKLSELRASLPEYSIVKKKVSLHQGSDPHILFEKIRQAAGEEAKSNLDDGLRLDFKQSWVHLRASNTEPILRVIAEAPTEEEAEELALRYQELVEE